jgi:hypothetical protein
MKRREAPKKKGEAPTRDEIEAEVPGAKSTEAENNEERRVRYQRDRRGLEPDEETC